MSISLLDCFKGLILMFRALLITGLTSIERIFWAKNLIFLYTDCGLVGMEAWLQEYYQLDRKRKTRCVYVFEQSFEPPSCGGAHT